MAPKLTTAGSVKFNDAVEEHDVDQFRGDSQPESQTAGDGPSRKRLIPEVRRAGPGATPVRQAVVSLVDPSA